MHESAEEDRPSIAPKKNRFIESSSFFQSKEFPDPFSEMKIRDSSFLEEVPQRSACPKCRRSRKYYCYTCYVPVEEVAGKLPMVDLPVHVDIIKHPKEVDGKSTSAHAAILAPNHVKVHIYPDIPSYENQEVLLIFPSKSAVPFREWWLSKKASASLQDDSGSKCEDDLKCSFAGDARCDKLSLPFEKVVFIDSTWRQSKTLYSDPRLKCLPAARLHSPRSLFWRYSRGRDASHLSTVEALYHFLVELHALSMPRLPYAGQYDDLLLLFRFMYRKIHALYHPRTLRADRQRDQ